MSATTDRIENTLKVQLAGVMPAALRLELYFAVEELCRDALQMDVGGNPAGDPADWLGDALWNLHQRLIIDGTLARLMAQPDKPYSHPELAAVHLGFWEAGMAAARQIAATTPIPTAGYGRILANLRSHFPAARDPQLLQELFNVVDEFCRVVLQTTPPVSTNPPEAWLPADLYEAHFRLLMAGTTARLLLLPNKPWSNPELAAAQAGIWSAHITQARADFEVKPVVEPWQLLMENLRVQLPGSKDSQIRLELFNVVDEACRTVNLWTETIAVPLVFDQPTYAISSPNQGTIVELLDVAHATMSLRDTVFDPDTSWLDLGRDPDEKDLHTPVFVMLRLAPPRTAEIASYLPGKLWSEHHQLLLDGTLGRMMAQPAKPFSSPQLASYHLKRFRNALGQVNFVSTGSGLAWRFPSAFIRRSAR